MHHPGSSRRVPAAGPGTGVAGARCRGHLVVAGRVLYVGADLALHHQGHVPAGDGVAGRQQEGNRQHQRPNATVSPDLQRFIFTFLWSEVCY